MKLCEYPNNTPSTAYGKGCRCDRCVEDSRAKNHRFFAERMARTAARKAEQLQRNLLQRVGCQFPQYTALTAYQRGCRCIGCVTERRAVARRSQAIAYARDPAKFIARQQAYLARKKKKEMTNG
jgi:hypothetical protein